MGSVKLTFMIIISTIGFAGAAGGGGMPWRDRLSVSLNHYYYHYSETFDAKTFSLLGISNYKGKPKSDEFGRTTLLGIAGTIFAPSGRVYAGAGIEYGSGRHTYDGSIQKAEIIGADTVMVYTPFKIEKNNTFTKVHALAGPCFSYRRLFFGIRSGIDYRIWDRKLLGERYTWLYVPVNLQAAVPIGKETSLGCGIEYRIMAAGKMRIEEPGVTIAPLLLGKKPGILVEFPFQTCANRLLGIECKPWFEYRPFGISNVDTLIENNGEKGPCLEPASESYSIGCVVSLLFGRFYKREEPAGDSFFRKRTDY